MTWNAKISAIKNSILILVLALLPLTAQAWIEIGQPDETMYYPFPAYSNDSKTQFIIPAELINGTGMLTAIEFNLSSCGMELANLDIKVKALPADSTSFSTSDFYMDNLSDWGLFTDINFCPDAPGWVRFDCTENTGVIEEGENLLIQFCATPAETGTDNFIQCWASENAGLAREGTDVCDDTAGMSLDLLPHVRLYGLTRAVSGIWHAGQTIHVDSDIYVPEGESLEIRPGVEVIFDGFHVLEIEGEFSAIGVEGAPITFTAADPLVGWNGIIADYFDVSLAFDHCRFEHFRGLSNDDVNETAAVYARVINSISIKNSVFTDCIGRTGASFYLVDAEIDVEKVLVEDCSATSGYNPIIGVYSSERTHLDGVVLRGGFPSTDRAISFNGAGGEFLVENCVFNIGQRPNTIYDTVVMQNCTFTRDGYSYGYLSFVGSDNEMSNCILSGGAPNSYMGSISSTGGLYYGHNLFESHLAWHENADRVMGAGNLLNTPAQFGDDYSLTAASPAIDAGSPYLPNDPDLTPCDMGAYFYDQSRPSLSHLADVPADQGHQLQVVWDASSMDVSALDEFGSYSVWRQDELFLAAAQTESIVRNPADILDLPAHEREGMYWEREDGSTWCFLEQIPATRENDYSIVAPTLQDSSNVDPNASTFRVMWHCSTHLSESSADSASSVDNIAPDAVLDLHAQADMQLLTLDWSPITMGTLDGNSYPELNGVHYKVYHGETMDFPCDEAHFLTSTSETTLEFTVPASDSMGFFKIRTND